MSDLRCKEGRPICAMLHDEIAELEACLGNAIGEIERLQARVEALNTVLEQSLTVPQQQNQRLRTRVEELERSIQIRDNGARRQKARVEALEGVRDAANDFLNNHMDHDDAMLLYEALAATEQVDPDHEPENSMCACPTCINEGWAEQGELPWTDKDGNTQSSTLYGSGVAATEQGESDE